MEPIAPTTLKSVPPGANPHATAIINVSKPSKTQAIKERVEDLRAKAEEVTRREPVKAILIALAAGLVVGRLLHALGGLGKNKDKKIERVIIREPRDLSEWPA